MGLFDSILKITPKTFSLGGGILVAFLAGIPLFLGSLKNIFFPPQQTSPPLWVIVLVGVIIIMMMRRKQ